jgi:hypothetical protein
MDRHPDWKPLSDEWFFAIVAMGGRARELADRLRAAGWFSREFYERSDRRAELSEIRRRIKKPRDGHGMPLYDTIAEEIEDELVHFSA